MNEPKETVKISMHGGGYRIDFEVTPTEAEPVFQFLKSWWNELVIGGEIIDGRTFPPQAEDD